MNIKNAKERSAIIKCLRQFLEENEFIEIYSPKLIKFLIDPGKGKGKEGIKVRYKGERFLAQSDQKFKEEAIQSGLARVYEIGFYWRDNIYKHTERHNSEFLCLDIEMKGIKSEQQLMTLIQNMLKHLLNNNCIRFKSFKIKFPIPRIKYDNVINILNKNCVQSKWGEDLAYKREKSLWKLLRFELGDIFFIYKYPSRVKKFYTKRYQDEKYTHTFDLIFKGWEICSGAIREIDRKKIRESLKIDKQDKKTCMNYESLFSKKSPNHGGFGFGLDRFVALLLGYKDITSFYKDIWITSEVI
jgi:nondiscriminating aspartyl-tRNA synthetase